MGTYIRLVDYNSQQAKEDVFLSGVDRYVADEDNFIKIPGMTIAYWASARVLAAYKYPSLEELSEPRHGLATSNNDLFLKLWFEVNIKKASVYDKTNISIYKWFPMNKGGSFRRWFGNNEWLINYENNGLEIKRYASEIYKSSTRTIQNTKYYFLESLTWSALSSGNFSVRWSDVGAIFGSGGYSAFVTGDILFYILALMNNKVTSAFIKIVSPTLNYEVGHIKTIPVIISDDKQNTVNRLVKNCISKSKTDWDVFETSWDFKRHPFV